MLAVLAIVLQIFLLLWVAVMDIRVRLIPNTVCMLLAGFSIARLPFGDTQYLVMLVCIVTLLTGVLLILYSRGWLGGGDIKLLTALAIGLSLTEVFQFFYVTAIAGAGIALVYLAIRLPPYPSLAPSFGERWRNLLRAPLPYGVAIACGGMWVVLKHGV
jgi:prepilin peptidase CpaA